MALFQPITDLEDAVRRTVIYADIFDFPLERGEIWRDLIGVAAPREETFRTVDKLIDSGELVLAGPFPVLPGRTNLAVRRDACRRVARRLWPTAYRFGEALATLPFVRMVAVTGSLAAENPDAQADLDYLIVTTPGRLWLVRAMTIAFVRLARAFGDRLCPNYLLTTRALELEHRDLFTAHELLQAVPIAGRRTYQHLIARNQWAARWLPNRFQQALESQTTRSGVPSIQHLGELILGGATGSVLESWEATRKRNRLSAKGLTARFTADVCEGHYGRHRQRVLRDFEIRSKQSGIELCLPNGTNDVDASPPIDQRLATIASGQV